MQILMHNYHILNEGTHFYAHFKYRNLHFNSYEAAFHNLKSLNHSLMLLKYTVIFIIFCVACGTSCAIPVLLEEIECSISKEVINFI